MTSKFKQAFFSWRLFCFVTKVSAVVPYIRREGLIPWPIDVMWILHPGILIGHVIITLQGILYKKKCDEKFFHHWIFKQTVLTASAEIFLPFISRSENTCCATFVAVPGTSSLNPLEWFMYLSMGIMRRVL